MLKKGYRPEIDGLRAVAVLAVVLFHAGLSQFKGGFVGVDVFFVISGYLITRIIINGLENNEISYIGFLARRIRRIVPVLLSACFATLIPAYYLMAPTEFREYGQSLISLVFLASNIYFFRENGYFEHVAEEQPLLHTWSLSVEEQFYLIYPLLLIILFRRAGENKISLIKVLVAVMVFSSFSLAAVADSYWRNAGFYMMPTRLWELLAGGYLSFCAHDPSKLRRNMLSLFGSVLLLVVIVCPERLQLTPFQASALAVVGSCLLIHYSRSGPLKVILRWRGFVWIGLISYSMYLWHQPIFAFARIWSPTELSVAANSALILFILLLSALSYRLIERPCRDPATLPKRWFYPGVGLAAAILLSCALLIHMRAFLPASYSQSENILANIQLSEYGGAGTPWVDLVENPKVLLYGDSHALQYSRALREAGVPVSVMTESACLSMPGIINEYKGESVAREQCLQIWKKALNYISENSSVEKLVIAYRWDKLIVDTGTAGLLGLISETEVAEKAFRFSLTTFLDQARAADVDVVVLGNVPGASGGLTAMQAGLVRCVYRHGMTHCPVSLRQHQTEGLHINMIVRDVTRLVDGVRFANPYDALCKHSECFNVKEGSLIYSDAAHLTRNGAQLVIQQLGVIR